jgi:hypothetical protein
VNRFFAVTLTVEAFRLYLAAPAISDASIKLGSHYSIAMNEKLKAKFKHGNVQLRFTPAPLDAGTEAKGSPTLLFRRPLAASVPMEAKPFKPKQQPRPCGNLTFLDFNPAQFPVNESGTSAYSQLR